MSETTARSLLAQIAADMRELDGLYNRDRVVHYTAQQIERIFDRWNHERRDEIESLLSAQGEAPRAQEAAASACGGAHPGYPCECICHHEAVRLMCPSCAHWPCWRCTSDPLPSPPQGERED